MSEHTAIIRSAAASSRPYELHKDEDPLRTVARIKDLLSRTGFLEENAYLNWKQPYPNCFSCFLTFRDYPFLIANGKGITRECALASAYAEFIERLQCRGGFHFSRLGLIENEETPALPRKARARDWLYERHRSLFENMDSRLFDQLPAELPCLPVCDLFRRAVVELPLSLMYTATGTTGMCAGNSFEEACGQGLGEVMERHAFHRFYTGEVEEVPTIDLGKIKLRSLPLKNLIGEIEGRGCAITVKDFSLGGRFPVLGVVVREKKTDRIAVALGSDPIFEIALQRCLTEAFQGRARPELVAGGMASSGNKPDSIYNTPHLLAERLLRGAQEGRCEEAFLSRPASNREYLRFLLNRVRPAGGSVFIRDFSILGFPSYYLYVEKMSPINPDFLRDVKLSGDIDRILSIVFTLPEASGSRIKDGADLLFDYLERHASSFLVKLGKLFGRVPVFSWLDPRWLLAFMLIEAEEYGKAALVLDQTLPGYAGEALAPAPPAADVLSRYCRLKAAGERDRDARRHLRKEFGGSVPGDRLDNLVKKNYAGFFNPAAAGWKFEGLPIPRCHDRNACRQCPCRDGCFRGKWHELRSSLKDRAREMDQSGILAKIAGVI